MGEMYLCRLCNNLFYESRNESRLGRWGKIGYFLVAEKAKLERFKRSVGKEKKTKITTDKDFEAENTLI
jgi:hypothetical protein